MANAELFWLLLNMLLPVVVAVFVGYKITREPGNKRWEYFLLATMSVFLFSVFTGNVLNWTGHHFTWRDDLYVYQLDHFFGEPSFFLGRVMEHHVWLNIIANSAYQAVFVAQLFLLVVYFLTQTLDDAICLVRTLYTSAIALPLYLVFPCSGPLYVFKAFPNVSPTVAPHPINLTAPPNCLPSLHMTIAIVLLYFASRWRVGTILGTIYLALIVLSTLGTGEHYVVDLIAAVPFSALVIWLGGASERLSPQPAFEFAEGWG